MGLTERHWFENEDVPENYEWALEDAVYNSRATEKVGEMGMTDRDIIKAELQNLQRALETKADICVGVGKTKVLSFANACSGALKLLKEQKAIKPDYDPVTLTWSCGNCGQTFDRCKNKFCHNCGRAVKWE